MSKRLELVWPNKDKILLGLDERGKPIWGTKDDLEPPSPGTVGSSRTNES